MTLKESPGLAIPDVLISVLAPLRRLYCVDGTAFRYWPLTCTLVNAALENCSLGTVESAPTAIAVSGTGVLLSVTVSLVVRSATVAVSSDAVWARETTMVSPA